TRRAWCGWSRATPSCDRARWSSKRRIDVASLPATGSATDALDALLRGLFDGHGAEAHLARLARLLGADALAAIRLPRRGPAAIMAAWCALDAEPLAPAFLAGGPAWERLNGGRLVLHVLAGRPVIRLLFDAKSADRAVLALARPPGAEAFSA